MPASASRTGRILRKGSVRLSDDPVVVGAAAPTTHGEPSVAVQTDPGTGRVSQIEVRCRCGEVTIVDCQYDDLPPSPVAGT